MERTVSQEDQFLAHLEDYRKLISKVARIYCQDSEDRKDLIQDIIIQLWRSFPNYDTSYAFSTWTYRIAINVSISFLRKLSSRKNTQSAYRQEVEWLHVEETANEEKVEQLYRFIDRLKPLDKAIIILQLEGCSNKEIAEVMGMSATNISTRKQRIKQELKSYFETSKYEQK